MKRTRNLDLSIFYSHQLQYTRNSTWVALLISCSPVLLAISSTVPLHSLSPPEWRHPNSGSYNDQAPPVGRSGGLAPWTWSHAAAFPLQTQNYSPFKIISEDRTLPLSGFISPTAVFDICSRGTTVCQTSMGVFQTCEDMERLGDYRRPYNH